MFDLTELGNVIPSIPGVDIRIRDFHINVEPPDIFLLPSIHIDAKIDIEFPW